VVIRACRRRGLDPVPYLLAVACAANVGSAATLIGNPQNILIGQVLGLSFAGYLLDAGVPAALGLAVTWAVIARQHRGRRDGGVPSPAAEETESPVWNAWQAAKGLGVTGILLAAFLFGPWPRDMLALGAAGVLLLSRRMHSRTMLGLVDWQLLVLFGGLFIVNGAVQTLGLPQRALEALSGAGIDPGRPAWLFAISAVLSNVVSNVPAVMLLLPFATHPLAGPVLALSSTLAGNLLIVGSIANIIVVDAAAAHGIRIDWRRHVRTGAVVTLLTLAVAAGYLAARHAMG
jgi:Na+/H+ antiporter NhaD/arsenite permease-like protein